MKKVLILSITLCIAVGSASAMSRGWAVPLEALGGYGVGFGGSALAFMAAGGTKGGFDTLAGALVVAAVYPGFSALGVYGVGELAEGDSENDVLSLSVPFVASYASFFAPMILGDSGASTVLALVLPPLVSTLAYNLVKDVEEDVVEIQPDESYTHLVSFSVGL